MVALCLSIFLEAIQRLVEPQTVSNPILVLIVGCFGLVSNILGLFLFHDHGHGHADHGKIAEEGGVWADEIGNESGNVEDVLPGKVVGAWPSSNRQDRFSRVSGEDMVTVGEGGRSSIERKSIQAGRGHHQTRTSGSRGRVPSVDDINGHPAIFRFDFIRAASWPGDVEESDDQTETESEREAVTEGEQPAKTRSGHAAVVEEQPANAGERSPLLSAPDVLTSKERKDHHDHRRPSHSHQIPPARDSWHDGHKHGGNRATGGGHSHSDLNIRGVFLHVVGDALGNIGVIGSALFIWLTPFRWRFYSDPVISLLITIIILASAIPLCKAASRILLQAVPAGINVDDIKADIQELPGVYGCHHVHVWQLSDTKLIASLHIQVDFVSDDNNNDQPEDSSSSSRRYMALAKAVRKCLHAYGIHSSTIQPEFVLGPKRPLPTSASSTLQIGTGTLGHDVGGNSVVDGSGLGVTGGPQVADSNSQRGGRLGSSSPPGSPTSEICLLECGDECADGSQCCAPNGNHLPSDLARSPTTATTTSTPGAGGENNK